MGYDTLKWDVGFLVALGGRCEPKPLPPLPQLRTNACLGPKTVKRFSLPTFPVKLEPVAL